MDKHIEILRRMADARCPILGTRQPEALAASWALDQITRHEVERAATYTVTLADLKVFADAACELDHLNGYILQSDQSRRLTLARVEALHTAIERIAGPDAGEIYAPDDKVAAEPS